jgi:phosphoglucosamine mutase
MEQAIFSLLSEGVVPRERRLEVETSLDEEYIAHLGASLPAGAKTGGRPLRVALDCGNGAATPLAPALFRRLGAEVDARNVAPDGQHQPRGGALYVEGLTKAVRDAGADVGFAFDGDADRCIAVALGPHRRRRPDAARLRAAAE